MNLKLLRNVWLGGRLGNELPRFARDLGVRAEELQTIKPSRILKVKWMIESIA